MGALTETATLRRFNELIQAGYRIEEISSTKEHVILEMENGSHMAVLRMGPESVRPFLDVHASPNAKRVAAGPR